MWGEGICGPASCFSLGSSKHIATAAIFIDLIRASVSVGFPKVCQLLSDTGAAVRERIWQLSLWCELGFQRLDLPMAHQWVWLLGQTVRRLAHNFDVDVSWVPVNQAPTRLF